LVDGASCPEMTDRPYRAPQSRMRLAGGTFLMTQRARFLCACRFRPHRPCADGERDLWLERNLSSLSPDPIGLVPMVNQILGYALGDDLADNSDSPTDAPSVRFGGAVDRASCCGTAGPRAAGPRPRGANLKICPGRAVGMGCDVHTSRFTGRWRAALPQRGYLTQPGVATSCGYPGLGGP
jgi:hypothetical protein